MADDLAGNSFNRAYFLGTFKNTTRRVRDTVSQSDSADYYQLKVAKSSYIVISLTNLQRDADFSTYDDNRRLLATFDNSGTNNELAYGATEPGTYYIKVYPASNRETDYTLTVHSVVLPRNSSSSRSRSRLNPSFKAMKSQDTFTLTSAFNRSSRSLWS